jgi:hypothetical protein
MRKIYWFAAAVALILAGIAGWAVSTSQARLEATATTGTVDPHQLMMSAKDLPVEEYKDYSLVFE